MAIGPEPEEVSESPVIIANSDTNSSNTQTKVYARRWLVLVVHILFASSNMGQWVQYSIISNIVSRYYDVSSVMIDWTSLLFMVAYVFLVVPISYMMAKIGLRWTGIVGCFVTALGSWIKLLSVSPDRFYVAFIGQGLVASVQVIVLAVPSRLAANWFGPRQVSTATSMGLVGFQLGIAGSFLFTPIVVRNHVNLEDIGNDLSKVYWFFAIYSTVALVATVAFVKDDPPLPPSETRRLQILSEAKNSVGFTPVLKRLLSNRSYLALCHSFGISIGTLNVIAILLNQLYLIHFNDGQVEAGQIGLLFIIAGLVGSATFGIILDRTRKFKFTICAVFALMLVGQIAFGVSLTMEIKWMIYASALLLGFFITSYCTVGYEVCAEYTYPEPGEIAIAFLNLTNPVYGTAMILIFEKVIELFGDIWAHIGIGMILTSGFITTLCTKDLQRRQEARQKARCKEVPSNSSNLLDENQLI